MAISDDWTIDYTDLTITHTSGTTVYEMYEMYAWLMDELDDDTEMDDTIPMTAQTPTAYTLTNGWFIDETSIQFLTGGSLKTNGWTSGAIRIISYNASTTSFSSSDIGQTITGGTTGDTGTVLHYEERYGTDLGVVWIRPDDTVTDLFDDNDEDFLVTGPYADGVFTSTLDSGGSITGENIWANPYTIGTLVTNTQLYLYQDDSKITPWWSTGHIDILVKIQEGGSLVDYGYVTIFARHYSKLYDHYLADLSGGARTPIPLAAFDDTNNDSGYRTFTGENGTGTFEVGEVIEEDADPDKQGIVTSVGGTGAAPVLEYYLMGYPQDTFAAADDITGQTSSATCDITSDGAANAGPAVLGTLPTISAFQSTDGDLNNGAGIRPYDVIIDCNQNPLTDVYEWLKYETRRGSATSLNGHTGEDYVAVGDVYLDYESLSGSFTEGNTVSGGTSGASGVIVSDHTTQGALVVRDVAGTFEEGETITEGAASADISTGGVDNIALAKQSPFGTFAGGKFFGARGVWITDYAGTDGNNFELIDSTGTQQVPPQTVAITISNTEAGDRVSVFLSTGSGSTTVNKSQFTSHATNNTSGLNTFEVTGSIPADTPSSGSLRVPDRNASGKITSETRYTFSGRSSTTFTGVSPVLVTTYNGDDTAYVPYIDEQASGDTVSDTVTYVSDREVVTRVRIKGMEPFQVDGTLTTGGLPVTTIRNTDSIYQ